MKIRTIRNTLITSYIDHVKRRIHPRYILIKTPNNNTPTPSLKEIKANQEWRQPQVHLPHESRKSPLVPAGSALVPSLTRGGRGATRAEGGWGGGDAGGHSQLFILPPSPVAALSLPFPPPLSRAWGLLPDIAGDEMAFGGGWLLGSFFLWVWLIWRLSGRFMVLWSKCTYRIGFSLRRYSYFDYRLDTSNLRTWQLGSSLPSPPPKPSSRCRQKLIIFPIWF